MKDYHAKIKDFLDKKSIAVAGVSRNPKTEVGNILYKKFKSAGYDVFPVNPNAAEVEGDKCYPNLQSIPSRVEGVVIATSPKESLNIVKECKEAGVGNVWIHSSIGKGSYSDEAVKFCEENGISIIPTGCPMMFVKPVDFPHKCLKGVLKLTGKIPFGG